MIDNVQIMNCTPFRYFFVYKESMHMDGIYKSLCQFRMRKSEVVATQDFEKHENDASVANIYEYINNSKYDIGFTVNRRIQNVY